MFFGTVFFGGLLLGALFLRAWLPFLFWGPKAGGRMEYRTIGKHRKGRPSACECTLSSSASKIRTGRIPCLDSISGKALRRMLVVLQAVLLPWHHPRYFWTAASGISLPGKIDRRYLLVDQVCGKLEVSKIQFQLGQRLVRVSILEHVSRVLSLKTGRNLEWFTCTCCGVSSCVYTLD